MVDPISEPPITTTPSQAEQSHPIVSRIAQFGSVCLACLAVVIGFFAFTTVAGYLYDTNVMRFRGFNLFIIESLISIVPVIVLFSILFYRVLGYNMHPWRKVVFIAGISLIYPIIMMMFFLLSSFL